MVNVRIVTTITVGGGGIVQTILPTKTKIMVIQGAMTMRGEMLTKNRRERGVVNRKDTVGTTVGVKKGRQRVKR